MRGDKNNHNHNNMLSVVKVTVTTCVILLLLCFVQVHCEEELPASVSVSVSASASASVGQHTLDRSVSVSGLTLNILYCYSCGYKKAFEDYASIISQQFPDISIHGANYDPPGVNMYLSGFIGVGKIILIASILSGYYLFGMFNQAEPAWYRWCKENKIYSCMMVFFLCNTIEGQLVSSGAFEISLNDIPVWSKLETGRIPQVQELFQIIRNTLQFSTDAVTPGYVK